MSDLADQLVRRSLPRWTSQTRSVHTLRVADDFVELGTVDAPSGALVLAMASWVDEWQVLGDPLSVRALAMVGQGGGHLHDWLCEAVAVPAAPTRQLVVRGSFYPSPLGEGPIIDVLEVDLGVDFSTVSPSGSVVRLGDLPIDRNGMVIGDAVALDSWVGISGGSTDGLADVRYWGRYAEAAQARFGGGRIPGPAVRGVLGWSDLPLEDARARKAALSGWVGDEQGRGVQVSLDEHTDFHRFRVGSWAHPYRVGPVQVNGCAVLGMRWEPLDHNMRHEGERSYGAVYPVTLEPSVSGSALLCWTVPTYDEPA